MSGVTGVTGGVAATATTAAALAGCLLVAAGLAKLRDGAGVVVFLRAAGLGARTAQVVRVIAPPAEVLVGGWLLSLRTPRAAGVAAMVLGGCFAAVMVVAMRRGVAVPCRCFGALDRAPTHGVSLARALLLLAAAATAVAGSAVAGGGRGPAAAWLLGVVLAVCCVVGFALVGELVAFRLGVRQVLGGAPARDLHGGPAR